MTNKLQLKIVFMELTVDEVCPLLGVEHQHNDKARVTFTTEDSAYTVKVNSKRLQCFAKSIVCAKCGIKGTVFRIETHASDRQAGSPHLNLYAKKNALGTGSISSTEDDDLVLMTKDHIIPKSKGGKDHLSNLQTMCSPCNEAKADGPNV